MVWQNVQGANWLLLALAVAVTTATFPARALRWRCFLAPVQPDSPFRSRFAAVCTGFMANNLLPARAGELARAFAYNRLEGVGVVTAMSTLVVERLMDGVAILLLLFAALAAAGLPSSELPEALAAGVRLLLAALAAVLAVSAALLVAMPRRTLAAVTAVARALLPGRVAESRPSASPTVWWPGPCLAARMAHDGPRLRLEPRGLAAPVAVLLDRLPRLWHRAALRRRHSGECGHRPSRSRCPRRRATSAPSTLRPRWS